ncbi:zf-CCHC_4 domain-containing protein, partial [Cephalotus follicularis]
FYSVKVRAPINEPLRRGMHLSCGCLGRVWVNFKYEKLPNFCFICGCLGHVERDCVEAEGKRTNGETVNYQFGQWLSAGDRNWFANSWGKLMPKAVMDGNGKEGGESVPGDLDTSVKDHSVDCGISNNDWRMVETRGD